MNTENKLISLDGLIQRLTELREIAGQDCQVVCGKSFDSTKEQLSITMVSLDLCPQTKAKQVAILVEPKRSAEERHSDFLEWQKEQFKRAFVGEEIMNKQELLNKLEAIEREYKGMSHDAKSQGDYIYASGLCEATARIIKLVKDG